MQTTITYNPEAKLLVNSDEFLELKFEKVVSKAPSRKGYKNLLDLNELYSIYINSLKEMIYAELMSCYNMTDAKYHVNFAEYIYDIPTLSKALDTKNLYDPILYTHEEFGVICLSMKTMYQTDDRKEELTFTLNLENQTEFFFEFSKDSYYSGNKLFMIAKDVKSDDDAYLVLNKNTFKDLLFSSDTAYKEFVKELLITAVYHL